MCHWTMGLNRDKTSKCFCINICCFSTRFYFFCTTVALSSEFYQNCGCFWSIHPHKTKTFTVRLAVTTNTKETVLQQMCCLDRRVVPIGPIVRGVIAFPILETWWDATTQVASQSGHWQASYGISNIFQQRPSAIFYFKNFYILSRDCHCCPNLLLYTKFHQNWFTRSASRVQTPITAEFPVRPWPLPWQPHYGGHVGNVMGCDQPGFVPIGPLLVMVFPIFSNVAAVRHFEF